MSDGTCGCGADHGTAKGIPGVTSTSQPQFQFPANHFVCSCGCNELRERVALLESGLYQLTLIVQKKEKGLDENDNFVARREQDVPRRRWIGDKGENA